MKQILLSITLAGFSLAAFSQNVGIGTTTPSTNLDVNGTIRIRGGAPAAGKVLQTDATGLATWSANGLLPSSAIVFSDNPHNTNLLNNGFQYFGKTSSTIIDTTTTNSPVQTWINGTDENNRMTPTVLAFKNNKFIVFGGTDNVNFLDQTSIYDPLLDTWEEHAGIPDTFVRESPVAIVANGKLLVWGGYSGNTYYSSGKIFDATTDTWTAMSSTGAPAGRIHCAYGFDSASNNFWIWGGRTYNTATSIFTYLNTGYLYNLTTNTWSPMNVTGVPTAKALMGFATGGGKAFLCGGLNGTTYYSSSFTYTFATNSWSFLPSNPSIASRASYTCYYTGSNFLAWGGYDGGGGHLTGAIYNPTGNYWTAMSTVGAATEVNPDKSAFNNNVLYFAHYGGSGKYDVLTNAWSPIDNTKEDNYSIAANNICLFAFGNQFDLNPITEKRKGERFFYSVQPIKNNYYVEKNLFLYKKN